MFRLFVPFLFPDKFAIRFIPRENGVHTIDVKFNGSHIPGSPFQVRVGEPGQSGEPGLVTAYGSGLERGTTGESPVQSDFLSVSYGCFLSLKLVSIRDTFRERVSITCLKGFQIDLFLHKVLIYCIMNLTFENHYL